MDVKVGNRLYGMSRGAYEKLLGIASGQVPFGVYAVEKDGYAELKADRCKSVTALKELKRAYRTQGFRVRANGGEGK